MLLVIWLDAVVGELNGWGENDQKLDENGRILMLVDFGLVGFR